jgi:hypothetical protein
MITPGATALPYSLRRLYGHRRLCGAYSLLAQGIEIRIVFVSCGPLWFHSPPCPSIARLFGTHKQFGSDAMADLDRRLAGSLTTAVLFYEKRSQPETDTHRPLSHLRCCSRQGV